tara:strand:- start:17807 stop:18061 length:255 start_codon:yes stop_codon:yes gene_type:complete
MAEKQSRKTRLYDRSQTIVLLNGENPRRPESNRYWIFDSIRNGMTVDQFLMAVSKFNGGTKDLQLLEESGHVAIKTEPQGLSSM